MPHTAPQRVEQIARPAAAALRERLERAGVAGVVPTTPMALAQEGLAGAGVPRAHRLASFEETFFLEDMRVTGMAPRRLREMLKFFYRNWTELAGGAEDDVNALEGIRAGKLHGNVLAAEPHGLADGPGRGERDELLDGKITLLETLEHLGSDDACSAEDCDYLACHGVVLSEYLDTLGYISES